MRTLEPCVARNRHLRDAIVVLAAAIELIELKSVFATQPGVAVRRYVLRSPTRVGASFVDDVRRRQPGFSDEKTLSGPHPQSRRSGKVATGRKGSERINELILIVDPSAVNRVLLIYRVVETNDVFAVIERIIRGEC